jgi:hypothetical protein
VSDRDAFAPHMAAVARAVLGEPNPRHSSAREFRYGTHGSLSVDIERGVWFDHEAMTGGGVLDFLRERLQLANGSALAWLRERDFLPPQSEPIAPAKRPVVEASYDYVDEDGEVLFQVLRYAPKTFRQRRPDSGAPDGWAWGVKGVRLVPYRLPELLEAIALDRVVFIAEGEKKVDALARIGVVATCNPMGAGKWPEAFGQYLAGARVVILPDNDSAGAKHRDLVAEMLDGIAHSVRILAIPGLAEKGDVADWIAAGGTADHLYALVDARAVRPGEAPFQSRYGALWLDEIPAYQSTTEWVVKGLVPRRAFGAVIGEPGCGKSFLALDLAFTVSVLALMHGDDARWFGKRVKPVGTVYIAAEGQGGFPKRVALLMAQHRVRERHPFVLLPTGVDLRNPEADIGPLIEEITALAARMDVPLGLVVIDTLNRALAGGDENSAEDMGAFIRHAGRIQEKTAATVIVVHHKNAAGTRERGHSSLRGGLDFMIEVEKSEFGGKTWKVTKQKDEEDGASFGFDLRSLPVGIDDDGDPITSCVVEPKDVRATKRGSGRKLPPQAVNALRILVNALCDHGQRVPITGLTVNGIRLQFWRDECERHHLVASDTGDEAFRKAFQRARDTLWAEQKIGVEGDWVWPILEAR